MAVPSASAYPYEVRCPMHGSIAFNEREMRIIDHPLYQRLRSISQLGFSSLVYPGATHTRFSHGLGVMLLAGRIFDRVVAAFPDGLRRRFGEGTLDYCRQLVRLAGLLHDIGHLPFSHAFEPLLPPLEQLPLPLEWYAAPEPGRQATHEDYSVAAVHALAAESPPLLTGQEARDVAALINEHVTPSPALAGGDGKRAPNIFPLLKQIISGEIDADRMDYLRRDAHFAGVAYGYFDQERLIQGLTCAETEQGVMMGLEHSALYAYENFLMTRFHMAMQVYLHKTVLLFDHYLHRAIEEEEITCPLDRNLETFLAARDDAILARLHAARRRRWAGRIVHREPFPLLIRLGEDAAPEARERILAALEEARIEHIHIREERRLSNLGVAGEPQAYPIHVREERLGVAGWRPLHEVSVLLERYNQLFVIENVYCDPAAYDKGVALLRSLGV